MEDISRELEKEIDSYSSPVQTRRKSETRLIAVDDFGTIKSADWIKKVLLALSVLSLILFAATFLFYKLYSNYKTECISLHEDLNLAEKKIKDSIKEKEYLIAKLVISDKISANSVEEDVVKKQVKPDLKPISAELLKAASSNTSEVVFSKTESTPEDIKNVGIEKFMIVKDNITGDLLINFRILNIASEKGDASGRVFVLLSSKDGANMNQLVVPTVQLKNSIPALPGKGQYFSIAHFKTVKFKIKNIPDPELFTKAIVFVFGKENTLILNEEINISISK